jgi:hypothetical protein
MRSAKQWRELFHEKRGTRPLADFILADLSGYRDNATMRTDDVDSLAEALDAMLIEGAAQHKRTAA